MQGAATSCETKREREIIHDDDFSALNGIYALLRGVETNDKIRALARQLKSQSKRIIIIDIINTLNKFLIMNCI